MNILIACEYSGRVRDAFIKYGHNAVSCDVRPTERPGPHIEEDVMLHLEKGWDMMIGFPPCYDISKAGAAFWAEKKADGRMQAGIDFFMKLWNADIDKICLENPMGQINYIMKPTQYIQPWWFGDPYLKKTGLWLKNLPKLNALVPRPDGTITKWMETTRNPKVRELTFEGVAQGMALQWGTDFKWIPRYAWPNQERFPGFDYVPQ